MDKYPHSILVEEGSFRAKINGNKLFQKLDKVVQSLIPAGTTKAMVTGAQEIITLESTPKASHRAFELVLNALHNAGVKLFRSQLHHLKDINKQHTLKSDIKGEIKSFQLHITSDFFDDPEELPFLKTIAPWFKEWLERLGFEEEIAEGLKRKLSGSFFNELTREWGKKREYYQLVETELQSPFKKAWERKYYTLKYQDELSELFKQGAMGDELLPLSKIYIEPYFLVHGSNYIERYKNNKAEFVHHSFQGTIHDYITKRLIHNELHLGKEVVSEKSNLIFLLGQPGQGKTSFCFCTASRLLNDPNFEKELYFIRLKQLDSKKLMSEPFDTIKKHIKRNTQLDFKDNNTVLILDGLDEVYMSQGVSKNDLADFYYKIEQEIEQKKGLTIILTSRYNYLNIDAINKRITTILRLKGLLLWQQQQWLSIYTKSYNNCKLTPKKLTEIHNNDKLKHIQELIEQPILLHIIATANIDIDAKLNRSAIYELLFNALINRSWDAKEGQLKKYQPLPEYVLDYKKWLQEIAFNIYQSDFEYIHKQQLLDLDSTKKIKDGVIKSDTLNEALKDLLVAFYFNNKEINKSDASERGPYKDAIEFLHKSLQEYLVAEFIWNEIKSKVLNKDPKTQQSIDSKSALELFFSLFGYKEINESIRNSLVQIINNDDSINKKNLSARMDSFFLDCLDCQFLFIDNKTNSGHNLDPIDKALNTFYGYWLILSNLSNTKDKVLSLYKNATTLHKFSFFIRTINLPHNLSNLHLGAIDFSRTKFIETNFRKATLSGADFTGTNLTNSNFTESTANLALFNYANLEKANLTNANLKYSSFINANLSHAQLIGATFTNVDFTGANLMGADFTSADFTDADFTGTNLAQVENFERDPIEMFEEQKVIGIDQIKENYWVEKVQDIYIIREKKSYKKYSSS